MIDALPESNDRPAVEEFNYDQLVLAIGAVSNYLGLANVKRLAFDFKTLLDAIRVRNHNH
jgi:NADH:ubiquinone reductase (H+-translocating)